MTDFYPDPDRWLWPVAVTDDNNVVSVVEDPGGASEATVTAQLTKTSQLGDDATYYCFGLRDPTVGGDNINLKIVDAGYETVWVRSLYEEVCAVLNAESDSNGNGLDYEIATITPAGSDHSNTGLRLQTSGGTTDIQWNFGASSHLDPRFFGWGADGKGNGGSAPAAGTTQDGPFSRWGVWYSGVPATGLKDQTDGKRPTERRRTFASSPHPRNSQRWGWTQREIMRPMTYVGVAGAHIWRYDRAGRTVEAGRAGLPDGDSNNALKHLWDHTGFGDDLVIVGHGQGESQLGEIVGIDASSDADTTEHFETGRMDRQWLAEWNPMADMQFEHAGEKYDIGVPYAANAPDDAATSAYEH